MKALYAGFLAAIVIALIVIVATGVGSFEPDSETQSILNAFNK